MCEKLMKRRVDVCCMHEVRWKGQGARSVGTSGRMYKLWWSGNDRGSGGVGILVKEEISGKVAVGKNRQSNGNCAALRREMIRIVCANGLQSGKPDTEKVGFYDEVTNKWDFGVLVKTSFLCGISGGMWENVLRVLKVCMGGMVFEKEMQKEKDC